MVYLSVCPRMVSGRLGGSYFQAVMNNGAANMVDCFLFRLLCCFLEESETRNRFSHGSRPIPAEHMLRSTPARHGLTQGPATKQTLSCGREPLGPRAGGKGRSLRTVFCGDQRGPSSLADPWAPPASWIRSGAELSPGASGLAREGPWPGPRREAQDLDGKSILYHLGISK